MVHLLLPLHAALGGGGLLEEEGELGDGARGPAGLALPGGGEGGQGLPGGSHLLLLARWANSRPVKGSSVLRVTVIEVEVQARLTGGQGYQGISPAYREDRAGTRMVGVY